MGLPGRHAIELFATGDDARLLLMEIEAAHSLHFGCSGLLHTEVVPVVESLADPRTRIDGQSFLAQDRAHAFCSTPVPQRSGGTRYSVSQEENPRSVSLRFGSRIGGEFLSPGQIGTISSDPESLELFDLFRKAAKKRFVRVKSFLLGPEAERMLDSGARLAVSLKTPPGYDLRR